MLISFIKACNTAVQQFVQCRNALRIQFLIQCGLCCFPCSLPIGALGMSRRRGLDQTAAGSFTRTKDIEALR